MRVECIVFDVDDTLYLERDYVRSGFAAVGRWVAEERGVSGFGQECWALFERGVRRSTFDQAAAALGMGTDSATIGGLVDVYREHTPDIQLLPDARDFLDRHPSAAMAVITDGPKVAQRAKIEALGLADRIETIFVTAEIGPDAGKPSEVAFEHVQRATSVPHRACCYVGDNPAKDFVAPRALGWRTVRVRRFGSLHENAPSGPDVDRELASMTDLARAIWPNTTKATDEQP
jgi:putative hydrolase of the HAD superfamily